MFPDGKQLRDLLLSSAPMTLTMDHVEVITVDSFTTLVDGHGSTERILRQYGDDLASIVRLWQARAVEYQMTSTFVETY